MSLLLTQTCEYAILVAVQQGRHFSHSADHDICIQSKLDLHLPAAIEDLIPPSTVISSPPASLRPNGNVSFDTTLAYLVSAKLLQRLRTYNAQITLNVDSLDVDGSQSHIGSIAIRVREAKMVVHHNGEMDEVNRFVVDRGSWHTLASRRQVEEVKVGLFVVAMPTDKKTMLPLQQHPQVHIHQQQYRQHQQHQQHQHQHQQQNALELKSVSSDHTPFLSDNNTTTTSTVLSSPSSHSFLRTNNGVGKRGSLLEKHMAPKNGLQRQKQLQKKLLASKKPAAKPEDSPTRMTTVTPAPKDDPHSLRRAQSHLDIGSLAVGKGSPMVKKQDLRRSSVINDFDFDQLSAEFHRIQLLASQPPSPSSRPSTSASRRRSALSQSGSNVSITSSSARSSLDEVARYQQIGKGTSKYTFYFKVIHADNLQHLCLRPRSTAKRMVRWRGVARRPYFSYTFLSTRVTCPASTLALPYSPMLPTTCFHLRGHLVDIQKWLDDQGFLEVQLVLKDEDSSLLFSKETVGLAHIPLTKLAFYRHQHYQPARGTDPNLLERTSPIHDLSSRRGEGEIAQVTVRLGVVSGWWREDEDAAPPVEVPSKRHVQQRSEIAEFFKNKRPKAERAAALI